MRRGDNVAKKRTIKKVTYYNLPVYLELSVATDCVVLKKDINVKSKNKKNVGRKGDRIRIKNGLLGLTAGYLTQQYLSFSRQGKPFRPSKEYLSEVLGLSKVTLISHLQTLQRIGLIEVKKGYVVGGYGETIVVFDWAEVKKGLSFESDRFIEEEVKVLHYESDVVKSKDSWTEEQYINKAKNLKKITMLEREINKIKMNIDKDM